MKKVSIITINYNSLDDTLELLQSIQRSEEFDPTYYEVIVVDNASKEDPSQALGAYPWVTLIQSSENLGFAGGNNLGIKASTGEYIFILNNDACLNLSDLRRLMTEYEKHPAYGVLCPAIKNPDGTVQFAGYTAVNKLTGRNRLLTETASNASIVESSYPHGAAMLISRINLQRVGLMKENYFLYYEELDWGHQIREKGLKVGVCPSCEIVHKASATTGKISELKLYFQTRNRILFARKNFRWHHRWLFVAFFSLVSVPKNIIGLLASKDFGGVRAFLEAINWHFQNDPQSDRLGYKFDALLK